MKKINIFFQAVICIFSLTVCAEAATTNNPPSVTIQSPVQGNYKGSINVSGLITDDRGLKRIELHIDNVIVLSSTKCFGKRSYSYNLLYDSLKKADGPHTIKVRAVDLGGKYSYSPSISVTLDNLPPSVSLLQPVNGAVQALATDPSKDITDPKYPDSKSISLVIFYRVNLDGTVTQIGSDNIAPYHASFVPENLPNGIYKLYAKAYSILNNESISPQIEVTVQNDNAPPSVSITSPGNNSTVTGMIDITATATDEAGVAGVQFKVDGVNLGVEDTAAPYSASWDTTPSSVADGAHVLTAVARDEQGNAATSEAITANVNRVDPPDPQIEAKINALKASMDTLLNSSPAEFQNVLYGRTIRQYMIDQSASNDSYDYYALDYLMDGLVSMYLAKPDLSYLDFLLQLMETMKSNVHIVDWTALGFPPATKRHNWDDGHLEWTRSNGWPSLLDDIKATLGWGRLCRIILTDNTLKNTVSDNGQTYGARAVALRDFLDTEILGKWAGRQFGFAIFWVWALEVQNRLIPLDDTTIGYWHGHQTMFARTAHEIFLAGSTGPRDPRCKNDPNQAGSCGTWETVSAQIASNFDAYKTLLPNGSMIWDVTGTDADGNLTGKIRDSENSTGIPETMHDNRLAFFLLQFYEDQVRNASGQIIFDENDVKALSKTFTKNIWNGISAYKGAGVNPMAVPAGINSIWFKNYLDGRDWPYGNPVQLYKAGGPSHPHKDQCWGMSGMVYDGWCRFSAYSPKAYEASDALYNFITDPQISSTVNAIRNRNGSVWGRIALTGNMAWSLRKRNYMQGIDD